MVKYACNQCHKTFEKDIMTNKCPQCGSTDIVPASNRFPIKTILSILGIVVVVVTILLITIPPHDIVLTMNEVGKNVEIEVKELSTRKLDQYKIEILDDNRDLYMTIFFDRNSKKAILYHDNMVQNQCYTFLFKAKAKKTPQHSWKNNRHTYCTSSTSSIDEVKSGNGDNEKDILPNISIRTTLDCVKDEYTVTIKTNQPKNKTWIYHLICNEELVESSENPIFYRVKSGTYTIKVYNSNQESKELPFNLKPIIKGQPLTKEQVQRILNDVTNGKITSGKAQEQLVSQNIKLNKKIGDLTTLYDILVDAEGYGTNYTVVNFTIDECTGLLNSIELQ